MLRLIVCILTLLLPFGAIAQQENTTAIQDSPPVRDGGIPRTRWDHKSDALAWTQASLEALQAHGAALTRTVPSDIAEWCPTYQTASEGARRAFWVGFLSALAKHESTFRADAIGGGGRWFGLLQIVPSTARSYNCLAQTGADLRHGPANLSCAIRIMATTVPRDGVISSGFRGVAADWGPLRSPLKRNEMMAWTRQQTYCKPLASTRPKLRPEALAPTVDVTAASGQPAGPQVARLRPKARPSEGAIEPQAASQPQPALATIRPRPRPQRLAQSGAQE